MIGIRNLIFVLLFLLLPQQAHAQVTFDGCVDFRGIPVASIRDSSIQDVAIANIAPNGAPIILYNPHILGMLSAPTRLFFYAHECAHHALAHAVKNIPMTREQEADCWGIRTLVSRNMVSGSDLALIQQDLDAFAPGDWTHLPGRQRAINLQLCLGG